MAMGVSVTKPFAERCRPLCTIMGKSMHAKVMAIFRHKNQLEALLQFTNIYVNVSSICSWSNPVNRMEIKPKVFMQQVLELT